MNRLASDEAYQSANFLKSLSGNPSGPGALLGFRLVIKSIISLHLTGGNQGLLKGIVSSELVRGVVWEVNAIEK